MWQRFILLSLLHAHSHRSLILDTIYEQNIFSAASTKTAWSWRLENPLEELDIGSARPISFHRILETPSRPVMKVFFFLAFYVGIVVFFYSVDLINCFFRGGSSENTKSYHLYLNHNIRILYGIFLEFLLFIKKKKKVHPH